MKILTLLRMKPLYLHKSTFPKKYLILQFSEQWNHEMKFFLRSSSDCPSLENPHEKMFISTNCWNLTMSWILSSVTCFESSISKTFNVFSQFSANNSINLLKQSKCNENMTNLFITSAAARNWFLNRSGVYPWDASPRYKA